MSDISPRSAFVKSVFPAYLNAFRIASPPAPVVLPSKSAPYFAPVLIAAPATGKAPPTAAPSANSQGVPSRPSVSQRNFPVSIAPCVAPSPTFPSIPTFFACHKTPPGVAIARPRPVPNLPPLYPILSVCAPNALAPASCCRAVSSLASCPSPPTFSPVKIPLRETSFENGADRKSPTIPRVPPTACDAPEAIPADMFLTHCSKLPVGAGVGTDG